MFAIDCAGVSVFVMLMNKFCVVCFGRRGGGTRLSLDLAVRLMNEGLLDKLVINSNNDLLPTARVKLGSRLVVIDLPNPFLQFIFGMQIRRSLKLKEFFSQQLVLIPMSSVMDVFYFSIFKKSKYVIRIIHELVKHPGDIWPTNSFLKSALSKCDLAITMNESTYTSAKEMKLSEQLLNSVLPAPIFEGEGELKSEPIDILFIGRVKKYKGIALLAKSINLVSHLNLKIVVAGEGSLKNSVKLSLKRSNVKLINRWLLDYEMLNLLQNSRVVIFPYIEASQSGILAWCLENQKSVVITPNTNLVKQCNSYDSSFVTVSKSFSEEDFADGILVSISNSEINRQPKLRANSEEDLLQHLVQIFQRETKEFRKI